MSAQSKIIADIPRYIFGGESVLAPSDNALQLSQPLGETMGWWLVLSVLLVLAFYLLWLNYWDRRGGNRSVIFRFLGSHHGEYDDKLLGITPSFKRYLYSGVVMGVVALWIGGATFTGFTPSLSYSSFALVLAAIVLLNVYQATLVRLSGLVIGCPEFAKMILCLKGIFYTITAIFVTPIILCYAVSGAETQNIFAYIIAFQALVIISLFIYETFLLFISKKVSVLHTILYLCTVEIFPLTLLWGIFYR